MQAMKSLFVTLCVIGLALAVDSSPLFLWGAEGVAKPSLPTISQLNFKNEIVTPLVTRGTLIVFLDEGLTNKDFGCSNSSTSKSSFARLQGVDSLTYYANVENPVEALHSAPFEHEYNTIDNSGKLTNPLELSDKGKIIFVRFEGTDSADRCATLETHDFNMISFTKDNQLGKNVCFMYTSASSTSSSTALKRHRRDTTAATIGGNLFREGGDFLIFYTTLTVTDGKTPTTLDIASMTVTNTNKTNMSVRLIESTGKTLSFDITLAGGYFFMTNVMYNNMQFRSSEVYSPTNFSYFCGNLTLESAISTANPDAYTLQWNSLQFQAPFATTKNVTFVFGDPWHCVGFFTGGILSGLLIVALLLTITFIGVCWMMDINTMDRFDDPKGKTITINASD